MKKLKLIIGLGLALGLTGLTQATVYVSKQGSDLNSGADWAHAKASIQTAIDVSNPGDQIWVGKGTYTETVTLNDNRKLLGSFAGTETDPAQRNMTANPTVFVQDGDESMFVPSYCTPTTTVDGFVFDSVGTTAVPLEYPDLECWGSPTFTNCLVTGARCSYETLVLIPTGSPKFQACTFGGNTLPLFPNEVLGTFMMEVWSSASFNQCKFTNNSSRGIYLRGSISFTSCSLVGNNGGVYGDGAKSLAFLSCVCTSNQNLCVGTGIAAATAKSTVFQGNSACVSGTSADIENCQFFNNNGGGGGLTLFMTDCLFSHNEGAASGTGTIRRCVFVGNGSNSTSAPAFVGGGTIEDCLFVGNTSSGGMALGIEKDATVVNCTFVDNISAYHVNTPGVLGVGTSTKAVIANCVLLGNYGGIYGDIDTTITLDHNDLVGDAQWEYMGVAPGPTDIHVDPGMFNPANGDCHLAPGSPMIGKGNPAYFKATDTDLDGISRLTSGKISLGAYEPYAMSITGLTINSPVVGGFNAVASVTLSTPAYYGLVVAFVESGVSDALSLPFPTGAKTANLDIPTTPVTTNTNITVTVVYGPSSKSTTLTVTPPKIISVVLPTSGVVGGNPGTGTLNFNGPVPTSASITLSSSSASLVAPASVAGSGTASQTFAFSTTGVVAPQSVTVTATYNRVVVHATVSVLPANLKLILLSAKAVKGGGRLAGYPYLDGFAAGTGAVISLTSSNPSVLSVPASFTIPAGKSNSSFLIQTSTVTKITIVNLTGSYHGVQVTVPVEVDP
jgi:hypothetical protein